MMRKPVILSKRSAPKDLRIYILHSSKENA